MEVVSHAVAKLNRLAGRETGSSSKSKWDECFLLSKSQSPHLGLLFFPNLHTSGCATDLSLWAIKEMAKSICRSMAALVASERHLWLNLSGIKEKEAFPFWPLRGRCHLSRWKVSRGRQWCSSNISLAGLRSWGLLGGSRPTRLPDKQSVTSRATSHKEWGLAEDF